MRKLTNQNIYKIYNELYNNNEIVQSQENKQITEECLVKPSYYGLWTFTTGSLYY